MENSKKYKVGNTLTCKRYKSFQFEKTLFKFRKGQEYIISENNGKYVYVISKGDNGYWFSLVENELNYYFE